MNIYVGNLSFQMTESDLRTEFEKFGKVERAVIINDKLTQNPRGLVVWRCRASPRRKRQ